MHKDFYASGFLYHPRSQQILLQQQKPKETAPSWSLLGGKNLKNETAEQAFMRIVTKILHLNPSKTKVHLVYTYFHTEMHTENHVSYARINKLEKYPSIKGIVFGWFNFKQATKLNISEQTKQDITIAQRVINASIRKKLGQRTLE